MRVVARSLLALALPAALAVAGSAHADDPAAGDEVRIDLSTEVKIPDLLNLVSLHTGRPVLWQPDDKAITGKRISGVPGSSIRTPKARVLDVVRSLLVPEEIVLVPLAIGGSDGWFAMDARVLASQYLMKMRAEAVEVTDATVDALERREGVYVTAAIPAELENLRDLANALRRLVTPNNIGSVQEVPDAHVLVVTDFAPNVAQVYRMLHAADAAVRRRRPRMEAVKLENARVESLTQVLVELWPTPAPARPPGQPGAGDPTGTRPRIGGDPATNSVILVASPEDLEVLRAVIQKLDVPEKPH